MEDKSTNGRPREEEQWAPSQSELSEILEKHQEWLDTEGNDGERANLTRANLRGAYLQDAHLEGAFLLGAHLEEALLAEANLEEARGLQARQLRGANVSNAVLPEAIAKFEGLSIVKEASQNARKLFISVLVACAYSAITVATKGAGGDEVTLPIIDVDIGVGAFYLVTSVLLTLLFGYFHLQMQRLWEEIAELPAIFPDGRPLDKKIHPWPITGIVRAHVKHLKEQPSPPFFPLQRGVAVLLA